MYKSSGGRGGRKAELSEKLIQRTPRRLLRDYMYYIGLDLHKKTISYCIKDIAGKVFGEGTIGATRRA